MRRTAWCGGAPLRVQCDTPSLQSRAPAPQVDTHRGKAVAEQFGVPFVEASAKTGTNVDEALTVIARDVLARMAQEAEEGTGGEAGAGSGAASAPDSRRKGKEKCSIV